MSSCDIFITPDMIPADGVLHGIDFLRTNIRQIGVSPDVSRLIIEGPVKAPFASLWLYGSTEIEFRGDVLLHLIVHDYAATVPNAAPPPPPGRLIVKGDLWTSGPILMHGTIDVTGRMFSGDAIASSATIRCNGGITAVRFITADDEIFVEQSLSAGKGVGCKKLTIQNGEDFGQPMIAPPSFHRDCDHGDFCAIATISRDGRLFGQFRRMKFDEKRMTSEFDGFLFEMSLLMWDRNVQAKKPANIHVPDIAIFRTPLVERALFLKQAWADDITNKDRRRAFNDAVKAAADHLMTLRLPALIERPSANGSNRDEERIRRFVASGA